MHLDQSPNSTGYSNAYSSKLRGSGLTGSASASARVGSASVWFGLVLVLAQFGSGSGSDVVGLTGSLTWRRLGLRRQVRACSAAAASANASSADDAIFSVFTVKPHKCCSANISVRHRLHRRVRRCAVPGRRADGAPLFQCDCVPICCVYATACSL